jgi:hypothetical protein
MEAGTNVGHRLVHHLIGVLVGGAQVACNVVDHRPGVRSTRERGASGSTNL